MNARTNSLGTFAFVVSLALAPFAAGCVTEPVDELANTSSTESPEPFDTVDQSVTGSTVLQAADSSCATSSVKALSKQIIDEARCLNGDAYVAIGSVSNLSVGSSAFSYLEKPARDKLVSVLKANPGKSMTLNSALRTIAQQYLLYRWYQSGRCGIGLAAKPGSSNHETGLALDVSQYSTWKPILQSAGFTWLGSGDPVHFDFTGSGAKNYKGLDVKAFQRLWNRNNPSDTIATDGEWGPQTEARMKKSPAAGFAKGATCGTAIQYGGPEEVSDERIEIDRASIGIEGPWTAPVEQGISIENGLEHAEETCSDHEH